jgi:hypothetical protein
MDEPGGEFFERETVKIEDRGSRIALSIPPSIFDPRSSILDNSEMR